MKPLPFVWPYALPFWATYVWAFLPEFGIVRRGQKAAGASDAKSIQVIVLGMWASLLLAYPLAFVPALQIKRQRVTVFVAGTVLLVAGSLLRRHCFKVLGASFTGDVRASADQQVVTRGAYAILRHPSYTGGILMMTGVGISLGSWASAILLAVVSFAVYSYRIAVEERVLLENIGEPYRQFMSTRKRLIPFVY